MSYMFQFICDEDMQSSVGNMRGLNRALRRTTEVDSEQLKKQFEEFLKAMNSIFDISTFTEKCSFALDEIELNLSVGSEGKISILSSVTGGISAGSGIKIKLKRRE